MLHLIYYCIYCLHEKLLLLKKKHDIETTGLEPVLSHTEKSLQTVF